MKLKRKSTDILFYRYISGQLSFSFPAANADFTRSLVFPGPKMVAVRNYHGTPTPPGKTPLCFQTGDYVELLKGDPDTTWWEV